jgi:acyl carrier protein
MRTVTNHPPSTDENADRLLTVLSDFARESHLPEPREGLTLDTRLESDLGLDSLSRSELIARIERGLGAHLPDRALLAATPRDLLALLGETVDRDLSGGQGANIVASTGAGLDHPTDARTLLDVLAWHRDRRGERVHLTYYDGDDRPHPLNHTALAEGAARVAARLRAAGLKSGGTVAIMLPTGLEYFFAFFGTLIAGGVPVPIYPPARPQQLEGLPAVHLRQHGRSQGRGAHPRQPARQHPRHGRAGGIGPRRRLRELAAALSRHGADRRLAGSLYFGFRWS